MERAASASTKGEDTPSSRNVGCNKLFDSLRVRDLPTSKHPKEEREAHLTGRRDCLARGRNVAVGTLPVAYSSCNRGSSGLSWRRLVHGARSRARRSTDTVRTHGSFRVR